MLRELRQVGLLLWPLKLESMYDQTLRDNIERREEATYIHYGPAKEVEEAIDDRNAFYFSITLIAVGIINLCFAQNLGHKVIIYSYMLFGLFSSVVTFQKVYTFSLRYFAR